MLHSLHSCCELKCVYTANTSQIVTLECIEYMNYCVWGVYTCSKLAPELNTYFPSWKYSCQISKGGCGDKVIGSIVKDPNVITIDKSCLCVFSVATLKITFHKLYLWYCTVAELPSNIYACTDISYWAKIVRLIWQLVFSVNACALGGLHLRMFMVNTHVHCTWYNLHVCMHSYSVFMHALATPRTPHIWVSYT